MYRYAVIKGKFTLSLGRRVSTGGDRQSWRHHLSLPLGNTFSHKAGNFPHIRVINFSIMPTCTIEHIYSSSNSKEVSLILKFWGPFHSDSPFMWLSPCESLSPYWKSEKMMQTLPTKFLFKFATVAYLSSTRLGKAAHYHYEAHKNIESRKQQWQRPRGPAGYTHASSPRKSWFANIIAIRKEGKKRVDICNNIRKCAPSRSLSRFHEWPPSDGLLWYLQRVAVVSGCIRKPPTNS